MVYMLWTRWFMRSSIISFALCLTWIGQRMFWVIYIWRFIKAPVLVLAVFVIRERVRSSTGAVIQRKKSNNVRMLLAILYLAKVMTVRIGTNVSSSYMPPSIRTYLINPSVKTIVKWVDDVCLCCVFRYV